MRFFLTAFLVMCVSSAAQDAMDSDSFEAITIRTAEQLELDTETFQITRIKGPVDMSFIAKDPANNLDLKADTMEIKYKDPAAKTPSYIFMEGNLDITINGRNITSNKAEIDLDKGLAVFTGKTVITMPGSEPITSEAMTVNMNTNKLLFDKLHIPRLSLTETTP